MMLDFTQQLLDFANAVEIDMPVLVGALDVTDSVSLYALPGGANKREFFDGTKDKLLNYEFSIKTTDQRRAIETLDKLADALHDAQITSENESFDFREITITSEPFLVGIDDDYMYYQLTITAELTIRSEL